MGAEHAACVARAARVWPLVGIREHRRPLFAQRRDFGAQLLDLRKQLVVNLPDERVRVIDDPPLDVRQPLHNLSVVATEAGGSSKLVAYTTSGRDSPQFRNRLMRRPSESLLNRDTRLVPV